ncbi:MAG: N-methyl-L-tryptophan oxidase [Acidimicrobiia bacterium]
MAAQDVDHVVVGLGGLGSAAAYWLAEVSQRAGRDAHVVGVEQFALGHDRGASHDHSRIIRYSYHRPEYVQLAIEAYETWDAVAAEADEELVVRTGGIDLFPPGGEISMSDYTASLDAVGIPYEVIDAGEVMRRHPPFRLADDVLGLAQADTGIAPAARGTAAHQRLAAARGVTLREAVAVERIESDGAGELTVVTSEGVFRSSSVVVCADAWTTELLAPLDIRLPLEVTREQVAYFPTDPASIGEFAIGRFPVWIWMDAPCFYGFPVYGDPGAVKAAEDVGGRATTARDRDFEPDEQALARMTAFLDGLLPSMLGSAAPRVKTCLYTMTPDRDFVLDTVPGHPGLQVGLGSAHGFKFASWFGRALAERAVLGSSRSDLHPFRFDRPALTDPAFVPNYMT